MILAAGLMLGVVKVSTQMTPKGSAVHSSQGRNLPHARAGAVGNHAHHRIEARHAQADDEKKRSGLRGRQAKSVGVEIQLQRQQGLEDEVGGHVAQAVSEFLCEGELLGHCRLVFPLPTAALTSSPAVSIW